MKVCWSLDSASGGWKVNSLSPRKVHFIACGSSRLLLKSLCFRSLFSSSHLFFQFLACVELLFQLWVISPLLCASSLWQSTSGWIAIHTPRHVRRHTHTQGIGRCRVGKVEGTRTGQFHIEHSTRLRFVSRDWKHLRSFLLVPLPLSSFQSLPPRLFAEFQSLCDAEQFGSPQVPPGFLFAFHASQEV